jgi:hypothetical protein
MLIPSFDCKEVLQIDHPSFLAVFQLRLLFALFEHPSLGEKPSLAFDQLF